MLRLGLTLLLLLCMAQQAFAHFGLIIPSKDCVLDKKDAKLNLSIAFAHPMEGHGMPMAKPRAFQVFYDGQNHDLLASLKPTKLFDQQAWMSEYLITQPNVYQFWVEPEPYFESAEDCYIVHYSKVIVPAFGEDEGWDKAVGLPTEIVPLTRPFGNYAGNVFQGQVLVNGKPAADCDVEVEYYNAKKDASAPSQYHITQVVKTDGAGIFTFAVPWPGWWGFAALNTADKQMEHAGQMKDVELGAVLWLNFARGKK
ncbi:MAG: DUF4198 domain-containing protein [Desulfovibrio sp.]|nr:DUF4198 domain-containing protein [Desulfovibrio sp.]